MQTFKVGQCFIVGEEDETEIKNVSLLKSSEVCSTCNNAGAKYRCPRCDRRSCSLVCIKQHKVDHDCSGLRDRTAHIPIQTMSTEDLVKDYRFLEEVAREDDAAARRIKETPALKSNKGAKIMEKEARARGVSLRLIAPGMKRRTENSSVYNKKSSTMMWRVEWRFKASNEVMITSRMNEKSTPREILAAWLEKHPGNAPIRHKLAPYVESGLDQVSLFLTAEGTPGTKAYYHAVEMGKPLKDSLSGR